MNAVTNNHVLLLYESWKLAIDPDNRGIESEWFRIGPVPEAQDAPVPGMIQQLFPYYHGAARYWKSFRIGRTGKKAAAAC